MVDLKKKVVKNAPLLKIYQVRHPRGAFKKEGREERSSSEIIKIDTHVVHLLEIIKSVTHVVHLPEESYQERIPSSEINKIGTHMVHLLEITKSDTHVVRFKEEGRHR